MHALFIGHTYIDVTMVADSMPTGDEKSVAKDYAVSFGGNAVSRRLRLRQAWRQTDLLTTDVRRLARPDVLGDGA